MCTTLSAISTPHDLAEKSVSVQVIILCVKTVTRFVVMLQCDWESGTSSELSDIDKARS